MSRTWDRKRIAPAIANASQSDRKTSPAPETEAEAATEAAAERSSTTRDETSHHGGHLGDARAWQTVMMTPIGARIRAAPTETRQRLSQGLTHSSDLTREGLAMKATQCCYPPCSEPVAKGKGRFFCNGHEYRWRLGGERKRRPSRGAPEDVAFNAIGWTVTESGCWEWDGSRSTHDYGRFRGENATRVMWRITTGEVVPSNLHVCHACDNPPCVNPDHLFLGTRSDNMRDMVAKGRHPYVKGTHNHRAKLTDEQVAEIRARYTGAWGEFTRLADEYGVTGQHIAAIVKGYRR